MIQSEPSSFEKYIKEQVWKDAIAEEYKYIKNHFIWDVVSISHGKYVLTLKWLFKIKHGIDDNIKKYKSRSLARGFSQKVGEDYNDIFSDVACYTTI